jgi:hypothetical protein
MPNDTTTTTQLFATGTGDGAPGIDYDTKLAGCQECGAVVYDTDQHTAWHAELANVKVQHPTKHPTKHDVRHELFQPAPAPAPGP